VKVLFLVRDLPWPPNSGARLRAHNLLVRMARQHRITVLGYWPPERNLPPEAELFDAVVPVPEPPRPNKLAFAAGLIANIASPTPYAVSKHLSREMQSAVERVASQKNFDLVHCDSLPLAQYALAVPRIPKVLDEHNVEASIWRRHANCQGSMLKRLYAAIQASKMNRFEQQVCSKFDCCIAVSELDAREIKTHYGARNVVVVPNGVDTKLFTPFETQAVPGRIVFTGSMDWLPNQDAVLYFAESIWPLVKRRLPHASFEVVGRRPPESIKRTATQHGFHLVADAPDIRPHIAEAEVVVVPLRVGGGTRLKILEALSMAKPVVSTTIGAEGLELAHGTHILLADNPRDFADRICALLTNPGIRAKLGDNGRHLVVRHYDWDIAARALNEAWHWAVSPTAQRSGKTETGINPANISVETS